MPALATMQDTFIKRTSSSARIPQIFTVSQKD
jgi:hypothetical protein